MLSLLSGMRGVDPDQFNRLNYNHVRGLQRKAVTESAAGVLSGRLAAAGDSGLLDGEVAVTFPDFLKSLETEGGKVLIIILMLIFIVLTVMTFLLTGHQLQEMGKEMITGAVSSLLGILYGYLKAGSK